MHIAKIVVDGEEFINCVEGDDYLNLFAETESRIGGEVALLVWKPVYGVWLRAKISISAQVVE